MKNRTLFILVTCIGTPVFLLALCECILFIAGFRSTFATEDPFLGFQHSLSLYERFAHEAESDIYRTRPSKLTWFNPQQFSMPKPDNTYRIFCFGGSTTYGRPYTWETSFPNWLEITLQKSDARTRYEVINSGGVSYASYRIVNLMQEIIDYDPDCFIVYSGHNEFLEDRTYADIKGESAVTVKVRSVLNRLRTYSLIRRGWLRINKEKTGSESNKHQMSGEVKTILDQSFGLERYHRDTRRMTQIENHFQLNLERMVDLAKMNHIQIIFVVPPSNVKDFSPFKSEFSYQLTPKEQQRFHLLMQGADRSFQEQEFEAAAQAWNKALSIDSVYADVFYRLGKVHMEIGQPEKAYMAFQSACDEDAAPLRATRTIQSIVRKVCAKVQVPLVDWVVQLENDCLFRYGHANLGNEYFLDHAHPVIDVHQSLALTLADTLMARHIVPAVERANERIVSDAFDSVLANMDSVYFRIRDLNLAKVLEWAGKSKEAEPFIRRAAESLSDHPEAQLMRAQLAQKEGDWELTQKLYERALSLDSNMVPALIGLGLIWEKQNNLTKAESFYRQALELNPESEQAAYNLGVVSYQTGRIDRARSYYLQVLGLNPYHVQALNNLGVIDMNMNQLDSAESCFNRILELEPLYYKAHNNLALIWLQRQQPQKSIEEFNRTLTIDPNNRYALDWLQRLTDTPQPPDSKERRK
ncbi:tetratricopeptide repeat protein [candidate division KSB1 bacterium]|nr:tetratricopeptide repeat protein [candidate division KSB1 bacterium]